MKEYHLYFVNVKHAKKLEHLKVKIFVRVHKL